MDYLQLHQNQYLPSPPLNLGRECHRNRVFGQIYFSVQGSDLGQGLDFGDHHLILIQVDYQQMVDWLRLELIVLNFYSL